MTTKTRNPRRVILDDLRLMNRWMKWAVNQFDVAGTIYGDGQPRQRRADEYIENQPAELRKFAESARTFAEAMLVIANKAEQAAKAFDDTSNVG